MTSLRSYVWWLKRRQGINRVLAWFGLKLWLMANFERNPSWMFQSERWELTRWWPEVHRLSWEPQPPKIWKEVCATVPEKGEPQP